MKEKVVLAYSGGLDTTALIPWLKETFDYEVICCCVNCGQGNELDGLDERAKLSGASKLYIEDIVDDFCDNYVMLLSAMVQPVKVMTRFVSNLVSKHLRRISRSSLLGE